MATGGAYLELVLHIEQDGIPRAIPVEACSLGWPESPALLAQLVEPVIPG